MPINIGSVDPKNEASVKMAFEKLSKEALSVNSPENYGVPSTSEPVEQKFFFDTSSLRIYTFMNGTRYYLQMVQG